MKLVTQRDRIRMVVTEYPKYYPQLADALRRMDPETATPESIEAVEGNQQWVTLNCDECGKDATTVVECGAQLRDKTILCLQCVQEIARLAQSVQEI